MTTNDVFALILGLRFVVANGLRAQTSGRSVATVRAQTVSSGQQQHHWRTNPSCAAAAAAAALEKTMRGLPS